MRKRLLSRQSKQEETREPGFKATQVFLEGEASSDKKIKLMEGVREGNWRQSWEGIWDHTI